MIVENENGFAWETIFSHDRESLPSMRLWALLFVKKPQHKNETNLSKNDLMIYEKLLDYNCLWLRKNEREFQVERLFALVRIRTNKSIDHGDC